MNTRQAFEAMLSNNINDVCKKLKIEHKTFYSLKHRVKKKEKLSKKNMEIMLTKYGYKLLHEAQWKEPLHK